MNQLDIHVGADLRAQSLGFLHEHFGSSAEYLYNAVRGVDHRQVRPDRIRKSVGRERTFQHDLQSENDLRDALNHVIESVWERITKNAAVGRTVTLKVKYADFRQITRSRSFERCVSGRQEFSSVAHGLLTQLLPVPLGVRLIGLTMSSLVDQSSPVALSDHVRQHTFDF